MCLPLILCSSFSKITVLCYEDYIFTEGPASGQNNVRDFEIYLFISVIHTIYFCNSPVLVDVCRLFGFLTISLDFLWFLWISFLLVYKYSD